jgi:hypothetical protein
VINSGLGKFLGLPQALVTRGLYLRRHVPVRIPGCLSVVLKAVIHSQC